MSKKIEFRKPKPSKPERRSISIPVRFLTGLIVLVVLAGLSYLVVQQYQDSQYVDGMALERQVRDNLQTGTSMANVQDFLTQHSIEHSKNMTLGEIDAVVPNVKGSSSVTRDDLVFAFHFDYAGNLQSIETSHRLTGL
jgi:hypothetical protein